MHTRALLPLLCAAGLAALLAQAAGAEPPSPKEGDPVTIGSYRTLHSNVLGEDRQILVHLPDDYDRTTLRYPVLFHLYGQQVTNYFADAVMVADRLAGAAEIPPLIVVGVANTDRYRDNLPLQADGRNPGGADAFLRFFEDELIPFVDARYRTKPYRILAGPQAGGAFGLHALMTKPDVFDASVLRIENPFPGAEAFRAYYLDRATAFLGSAPRLDGFVRLVVDRDAPPATMEFAKRFAAVVEGARPEGLRFELHVEEPSGDFVPLVGLAPALRSLFEGYRMPADPPPDSSGVIEDHYRRLSARLGVDLEPPELALTRAVDRLMAERRLDAALDLARYELRVHPDALNALWRLGEINRLLGRPSDARDAYRRFLEIQPDDAAMIRRRLAEVEKEIEAAKE